MFRNWRRNRARKRVKPGDGSALKDYRPWHFLWRSLFFLEVPLDGGDTRTYAVDVDFFDWDDKAVLYRDGRQEATSGMPAVFEVSGGAIETDASSFGLRYMRMVHDDGREQTLQPHRWTGEALRNRFGRRFPRTSRGLGIAAIVVLLVSLALGAPQILELITGLDVMPQAVGTFTSPISLPGSVNTALVIASGFAAIERALTLRSHWLIDFETWWLDP